MGHTMHGPYRPLQADPGPHLAYVCLVIHTKMTQDVLPYLPNILKGVGCRKHSPRPQHSCNLRHIGQPGDEYHLVFECRALHGVRDKYPDLFGDYAGPILKFMWQADLLSSTSC